MQTAWLLLIAALWIGYFILDGFDFGVGALLRVLGRGDAERRTVLSTIGPVWDGNEVWVVTAVGATFAAFPLWYAALLSTYYLPLLAILAALIVRGVAIEYRGKRAGQAWTARWDTAVVAGSLLPAAGWGAVLAHLAHGGAGHALLGAATTAGLFTTHGAVFLALKTTGPLREHASVLAARLSPAAGAVAGVFLVWTVAGQPTPAAVGLAAAAGLSFAATVAAIRVRREGWAFAGTAATIALTVATLFATVDTIGGHSAAEAAASPSALRVLTWAAVLVGPFVLLYQGWTYWVFRQRVSARDLPGGH